MISGIQILAEKSLPNIVKYGIDDNDYLDFIKKKLNSGYKDFLSAANPDYINRFAEEICTGKVDADATTFDLVDKKDYWDRDLGDFVYTARILPKVKEQYPKTYEHITQDNKILPAGIDHKSRQNSQLDTIWNSVEKADSFGGEQTPQKRSKSSNKFLDTFSSKNDGEQRDIIEKGISHIDKDIKLTNDQLSAVVKFISAIAKEV